MVKCSECGFLGVWFPALDGFKEASSHLRGCGKPEIGHNDAYENKAKCFILKNDLVEELNGSKAGLREVAGYSGKVRSHHQTAGM